MDVSVKMFLARAIALSKPGAAGCSDLLKEGGRGARLLVWARRRSTESGSPLTRMTTRLRMCTGAMRGLKWLSIYCPMVMSGSRAVGMRCGHRTLNGAMCDIFWPQLLRIMMN